MAKTDWKVGDEVACCNSLSQWSIHRIAAITPSGLLKLDYGVLLYPSLKRRGGGGGWSAAYYREVTDEIREKALRHGLVRRLQTAPWENLPTTTLVAVHKTLKRCKADAAAAGEVER